LNKGSLLPGSKLPTLSSLPLSLTSIAVPARTLAASVLAMMSGVVVVVAAGEEASARGARRSDSTPSTPIARRAKAGMSPSFGVFGA
jgi:hypothetical protein